MQVTREMQQTSFHVKCIFVVKLRNIFDERKRVFLQKLVGVDLIKSAHHCICRRGHECAS